MRISKNLTDNIRIAAVAGVLLAAAIMSGCSLFPGGLSGGRDHSDQYGSAEEYCDYWFGPCEEVDSYAEERGGSDATVHVMKDNEFGFEYTVTESRKGYFLGTGDFAYYYIDEFLKSGDLKDIAGEYGLEFENYANRDNSGSPSVRIHTGRELSEDDNKKILDTVMTALDKFDSGRKVFNKKHDNIHVAISVWSAPWEKDSKNGALYHVVNETFGDNYKEQ